MAKIGQDEWAIAHLKWSVWVKNKKKRPKRCEKQLYDDIRVVVWKKPLKKTVNI